MTDHTKALAAFPDIPAADLPDLPTGWVDASHGNEVCPSYTHALAGLCLYAEAAAPEVREWPDAPRFNLYQMTRYDGAGQPQAAGVWVFGEASPPVAAGETLADVLAVAAPMIEKARADLVEKAAEAAANALAEVIQTALGVQTGDLAAHVLTGEPRLSAVAADYLGAELAHADENSGDYSE